MNELHVRAILAGVFFGCWPLFMNRVMNSGGITTSKAIGFAAAILAAFLLA